jgi:tetratricopeptide (TPR) repeat protein
MRVRPGDAFLHQRYARLLLDGLGDPARAEKHQRVVTEHRPQSFEAWHDLSEILARQGRYRDAISCARRALELRPESADAMSNIGIALRMQGQLEEALTFLERALDLDPSNAHVHFNYADCLMARDSADADNRRRAAAHFRRALELNPADAGARTRLEEFDTNNGPPVRGGIR